MPFDGTGVDITLPAGADMSSHQYKCVTLDSSGYATVSSNATAAIIGVLQNKPGAAGRAARVRISGLSLFKFGAAVVAGNMIAAMNDGTGQTTTTDGNAVVGMALVGVGASADISTLLVRPGWLGTTLVAIT